MRISEILNSKKTTISFEFFPPKKAENEHTLFETIEVLKKHNPDFVSITYGAGGSTKDKTIDWTLKIKQTYHLNPMMHLTCISSNKETVDTIAKTLKENKIDNILALRGDIPKDFNPSTMEFKYAYQLIEYLKRNWDFSIGVAGYPEGHPESPSLEKDIEYLKMKIDAGGEFIITQLFFDNTKFFDFIERAEKAGIDVPIIAGIMPILSLNQVKRFVEMCGATIPKKLIDSLTGKDKEESYKIGTDYAIKQCEELLEGGVRGLHFYTLNKYNATKEIIESLF
ncbi:methylenetetrahydrofolate reductase [NAD(P)H] [Hippea sp. KM1]|uniref:methylenetetrahydrofolate reductase [NAD(P)H] n=1 Tax=Hippea sp. KM1 TaxID=944481 RepID=UPI00046CF377|nr:methylenetetrahydrofolate reductase [NAD(P)H] [Hippea sp. KM1]